MYFFTLTRGGKVYRSRQIESLSKLVEAIELAEQVLGIFIVSMCDDKNKRIVHCFPGASNIIDGEEFTYVGFAGNAKDGAALLDNYINPC
jgi:hypothetical protein